MEALGLMFDDVSFTLIKNMYLTYEVCFKGSLNNYVLKYGGRGMTQNVTVFG